MLTTAYRLPDEQPSAARWTPNLTAAWVFVLTLILLLTFTFNTPLPLRIGRTVVWLLQLAGVEFGPMLG